MANNNDWNRNRMGSGQDWNSDDYRNQQSNRQRYGSGYGQGSGDYGGSGYEGDRFRGESERYRDEYNRESGDWNRGSSYQGNDPGRNLGSDYNRGSGSDYDRAYGSMGDYNRTNWGNERNRGDFRNRDRDWWDRTKDEVSSWFGDDEAKNRRRMDEREGPYRGKGPKGYTRSDDRIKEDVNDKLNDDSNIDASEIEVTVTGCEVTLSGTVPTRYEKRRAEDLAESVSGVKNVENRLRVNQESSWGTQGTGSSGTYRSNTGSGSSGNISSTNAETSTSGTNRNR